MRSVAFQLPALPSGLAWNTNQLAVTGTIPITGTVASRPAIAASSESGANLIISGNNGVAGGLYYVLALNQHRAAGRSYGLPLRPITMPAMASSPTPLASTRPSRKNSALSRSDVDEPRDATASGGGARRETRYGLIIFRTQRMNFNYSTPLFFQAGLGSLRRCGSDDSVPFTIAG